MGGDVKSVASVEELRELAREVAQTLRAGDVLLLYGELGSGKTTFVQGLARALGISDHVTSPTFTIVGEYAVEGHPAITTLVHVDLYRLDEATAASDPAVRDVLDRAGNPGRITVIEWADRLGGNVPNRAQKISFQYMASSSERQVTLY